MSSEPASPSAVAPRRRLRLWAVAAGAVLAASAGLGWWLWPVTPREEPPMPDLVGVDPEVAEVVGLAREKVVRRPDDGAAWGRLGMVLRAHDFGDEANRCFRVAERLDPSQPRWPYLLGLTLVMTDPVAGIPCLERAVDHCRDDAAPRLRLAEVLLEQGQLDEAQANLEQVRRRDSHDCRARLGLGRLAVLRGQWRDALGHLEYCTHDEHSRKLAHTLRAEARTRLGESERGRDEQQLAAQAPEDQPWPDPFVAEVERLRCGLRARLQRAGELMEMGQLPGAVRLLDETAQRYPESSSAWLLLGSAWQQMEQTRPAEQAFHKAVRVDAESAEAWFRLGCVQALDRPREAADSFRRTLRLKPDHALAHFNLAHRLKELGDPSGAADEFRAALRCRPDYQPARDALRQLDKIK